MKDYMASLRNPDDLLSGDEYRLPKDCRMPMDYMRMKPTSSIQ